MHQQCGEVGVKKIRSQDVLSDHLSPVRHDSKKDFRIKDFIKLQLELR
jgi:hypothetical protein